MSWRTRDDLGLEIVGHVHDAMRIPDHWTQDIGRGFIWWAEDFAQTIWSDVGMFQNASNTFRVHAETDLFRGRGHAQDFEVELLSSMSDASLSSVIFDQDKDTFKLHCSVYATSDNQEFIDKLFMAACALQVSEAHEIGHNLAKRLGAAPATSGHPVHGLRGQPDPMLGAIGQFFKPAGSTQSRWVGQPEWRQMEWAMERQAQAFQCDHQTHLTAQFAWSIPDSSGNYQVSTLEVTTEDENPVLGHGLMFRLKLPINLTPQRCAHTALMLNNLERKEWLRSQFLGSWCNDHGALEFECFIPNTIYHQSILEAMSLAMAIRAEWASEQFHKWFEAARAGAPA